MRVCECIWSSARVCIYVVVDGGNDGGCCGFGDGGGGVCARVCVYMNVRARALWLLFLVEGALELGSRLGSGLGLGPG